MRGYGRKKVGRIVYSDQRIDVLDLPGTYSLDVRSPDGKLRDVLLGQMKDTSRRIALFALLMRLILNVIYICLVKYKILVCRSLFFEYDG